MLAWNFSPTHSSSHAFSLATWFGPPRGLTPASPWPWVARTVSGLRIVTSALLRLGFPSAPELHSLTSQQCVSRRSVLQKVRSHYPGPQREILALGGLAPAACKHAVSGSLSLPSRGSFHLSLTVLCSISHQGVFSLGRWSSLLPTGLSCPVVLWIPTRQASLRLRDSHSLRSAFPCPFGFLLPDLYVGPQPQTFRPGLGSSPFARRYSENRYDTPAKSPSLGAPFSFFSSGYLDVSVPPVPLICLCVQHMMLRYCLSGFPHSDTSGSMPACGSPERFAACRVLLRPLVLRHPPHALITLTSLPSPFILFSRS